MNRAREQPILLSEVFAGRPWNDAVEKLPEVETAKALMTEAVTWSVMRWLREKKRVRKTADQANAALDQLSEAIRQRWPDQVRTAYEALAAQNARTAARNHDSPRPPRGPPR